ncbi:MAG: protein-export rane protein SecD/SecF family [Verrucomicrobiaceae bacterium]|nr:protein-export rane protein SecD/SecF family [Verrucomicrobiaceae bacterium]
MNKYPLWKYLLISFLLIVGFFYAAPNLFAPDPAIQISGESSATVVEQSALDLATKALKEAGIDYFGVAITENGKSGLIRLRDREQQLIGQAAVQRSIGDGFVVALNLASTTPRWMAALAAQPMKLGLDLSGGVHFLLEVDTPAAVNKRLELATVGIKRKLREDHIRGFIEQQKSDRIVGKFKDKELADQAISATRSEYPELLQTTETNEEGVLVSWTMSPAKIKDIEDYAVGQNLTTLRNRVNELGVAEPLVQRQGRNRIVVELPGIQDTAEAKRILGKTANLEFRLEAKGDADTTSREQFEFRDARFGQKSAWLEREVVITGERVTDAKSGFDSQSSQSEVSIVLDNEGGNLMAQATRHNINRKLGVLFIERKFRTHYEKGEDGKDVPVKVPYDEKKIISLATIRDALGNRFRITGLDNPAEASELALLLRAGALAAPMDFVEERTVGPSLGAANIHQGVTAVWVGFILVTLFMLYYYRVFGLAAVVALAINIILLIACMSLLSATLTMPGIAGIALTVGMSVDANVLVFARIREELKNGMSPQAAINAGFERAFVTITDSNLTALLVALILYAVGTGPVRGFAVTLALGIITSMFTAITVTRAIINLSVGGRRVTKLWI